MLTADYPRNDVPLAYRVAESIQQTWDTKTLVLEPRGSATPRCQPGQFMMLYRFGVGEVPISISGNPAGSDILEHTIRAVGAVSTALCAAAVNDTVGVRGPYGTEWDLRSAVGGDVVIVGGGIGIAPLRPVIVDALAARTSFRRLIVIVGARAPADMPFRDDLTVWAATGDVELYPTVDHLAEGWEHEHGLVTQPLSRLHLDPDRTTAFLCGPEPMLRYCAQTLLDKSIPATRIQVSLERNMQCGVARCGHCQLGPLLLCRDGPVVDYASAQPLLTIPEL
ncbi:FAD/NAD(P)-binding protein [Hoyosella sp. YIM 151337]|uniref:FAD/NAD(P)-binding protein n=1 Tax=Hoyosella sp. YIM 151337 TaxID=2992742 RepID=UPI0022362C21|nr:FAD/NAD(P)-binding protein [Hoyosella sp. YIM 151337]MCW4355969.1 FAD/NAD(P)-binding protein [Hoyosella sp. YIM 151337]